MSKSVIVLASGRTEQRALPHLLGHLLDAGISVEVRIPPRHRQIVRDIVIKIAESCSWDSPGLDKLVVLVDVDGKNPDTVINSLRGQIGSALDRFDFDVCFGYAQWHLEAWFFGDGSGLRAFLGRDLGRVDASRPDTISNPKQHLKQLLGERLYTSEVAEGISRGLDAAKIEEKSASFSGFLAAVRNGASDVMQSANQRTPTDDDG